MDKEQFKKLSPSMLDGLVLGEKISDDMILFSAYINVYKEKMAIVTGKGKNATVFAVYDSYDVSLYYEAISRYFKYAAFNPYVLFKLSIKRYESIESRGIGAINLLNQFN